MLRSAYYLHYRGDQFIALMMEAVRTSEMSAQSNVITQYYISEDTKLYTPCCENLKSHRKFPFDVFRVARHHLEWWKDC
jgi:hypothetical protein